MPTIHYYCPCLTPLSEPPPPAHLPSSSASFHPLSDLYFCEECDAVRCNRCVSVEVSGYYCPNCLFEVPSASVRAEKNRCARNCFQCPHCLNTLAVVPSDPPRMEWDTKANLPYLGALNDPPFLLYCNLCRWDSAEVGITFEKPTGLAVQMQRYEDSAPENLEFERLKEHFEPYLRHQLSSSTSTPQPISHMPSLNPITAAASSALSRDIPGVSKYQRARGHRSDRGALINKEELPEYRSRIEVGAGGILGMGGGEEDVEFMMKLEEVNEVAAVEQRWISSWTPSLQSRDLLPLRMPLHSKQSKRCHVCRHILIKPEQKAQSVRYKIKLVAANYLPAIHIMLPNPTPAPSSLLAKRSTTASKAAVEEERATFNAGKTYPFQLALTNPLYDPIAVRLSVQRQSTKRKPSFAVSLPTSLIPISAFQEAWEYEDEDEGMMDEDLIGVDVDAKGKVKSVGVIERKANTTVVGGELVVGKDGQGDVKVFLDYFSWG